MKKKRPNGAPRARLCNPPHCRRITLKRKCERCAIQENAMNDCLKN